MGRLAEETKYAAEDVTGTVDRLKDFIQPFLPLFERAEQRSHAEVYVGGRLKQLPRRTTEPIAIERGEKRRPLQHFVGAGRWDDNAVRRKICRQVADEMGSPEGVLILDGSGFQKTGPASVGTQRQWCGRLGKEEQCQVGEFLVYASRGSVALVDGQLYLPKAWVQDRERRQMCYVPEKIKFKTGWQLAADMALRRGRLLPHRWIVGDENYGRPTELRDLLDRKGEHYVLEVSSDAKVRLARGGGWTRANDWAKSLPKRAWQSFTVRDGEKGPISVRGAKVRVYTPRPKGKERPEVLVIVRSEREHKTWTYFASDTRTRLRELVRVGSCRHGIEQSLNMGKGDVGLDEYEVRSWVGWHHHMTLSMLSLWFLVCEQRRVKKTLQRSPWLRSVVRSLSRAPSYGPQKRSRTSSAHNSGAMTRRADTTGVENGNVRRRGAAHCVRGDVVGDTLDADLAQFN